MSSKVIQLASKTYASLSKRFQTFLERGRTDATSVFRRLKLESEVFSKHLFFLKSICSNQDFHSITILRTKEKLFRELKASIRNTADTLISEEKNLSSRHDSDAHQLNSCVENL